MINNDYHNNVFATSTSSAGNINEEEKTTTHHTTNIMDDDGGVLLKTDHSFEFKMDDDLVFDDGVGGVNHPTTTTSFKELEEKILVNMIDTHDDNNINTNNDPTDIVHHLASHHDNENREEAEEVDWKDCTEEEEDDDEAEEDDFFAETYEEGDLPDYLKDRYVYESHTELARTATSQDIERNQFRVHGISKPRDDENPEMIGLKLRELDEEITQIKYNSPSTKLSHNYQLAESQCKEYVCSQSLRLMFLRSVAFDVKAAAKNMMSFFDEKRDLWGEEKLGKKITIDDFGEDGLEVLKNGHSQLLTTTRDDAGRAIIFNNLNHVQYTDDGTSQIRNLWYLYMTAFEDEETQKNGMIFIQYKLGKSVGHRPSRKLLWQGSRVSRSLPGQMSGMHACFNRESLPFIRLLKIGLEYHTSQRVRIHEGSYEEINYTLNCFGIPSYAIPVSPEGGVIRKHHLHWLEERRMKEKQDEKREHGIPATVQVIVPSRCDVLFGRGRRSQFHSGNLRLNMYLEDKLSEYELGNRKRKNEIVSSTMDLVKGTGGRFLRPVKKDGSSWEEVNEKDAKDKIVHDFRTVRKRLATGGNAQKRRAGYNDSDNQPNKVVSMNAGRKHL